MYNIIIWGVGKDYNAYFNNIKYYELIEEIKVIGFVTNDSYLSELEGYNYINKTDLKNLQFDIILVASLKYYLQILKEAQSMGINKNQIINIKVFNIPSLNLSKYMMLKQNPISLISNNCWAGITYNYLGLEFQSPTINMFQEEEDYIKFLSNLKFYLTHELTYYDTAYDENQKHAFPICKLNDIKIYMNHYKTFEQAKKKWEERLERINFKNLFIEMYTENEDILRDFDTLPYSRKICFVPFETNIKSGYYVSIYKDLQLHKRAFWDIINNMANNSINFYNVLDLLTGENNIRRR